MTECEAVCRTCLRADGLAPIFSRSEHRERYTVALFLTTGLQVEQNDGLPQTICSECINIVNAAIDFRNQSHRSEIALLEYGWKRNGLKEASLKSPCDQLEHSDIENDNYIESKEPALITNGNYFEHETNHERAKVAANGRVKEILNVEKKKNFKNLVNGPLTADGPYECKVCKKILKSWSSFRTHAKIHLGFDFMCEFCGKKFIAVTMLQRHCMSRHGAERTYRCHLCDHRALDSEGLKIHHRRQHTGERPYVCDACGAGFHTRRVLIHHLAVHATHKTVQCPQCPAKFKSGQHLACHTSKVHRRRRWRLGCYLCGNTYTKSENARKHLVRVHGVPRGQQRELTRVRAMEG